MYEYSVYKDTKGSTFVDNLLTRSTYFVVDPGRYSASTSYYHHRTLKASPLLYASIASAAPATSSDSASYSVRLYQGRTGTLVNSLNVSPTETTVSSDLTVPNDIYIGPAKEWRIHIDTARHAFAFQKLTALGTYNTEFEICHETL